MSLIKMRKMKGFTLIELMIVVAIIGILAAVAIPKFADLVTKSKEASIKGNLGAVRSALSIYYGDQEGKYPTNIWTGLATSGKYMPQCAGVDCLGSMVIPPVTAQANPGHDYGTVAVGDTVTEAINTSAAGNDAAAFDYSQ